MDKKTLFALLLILVVFWISSEFIWKPSQQKNMQILNEQKAAQIAESPQEPKAQPQVADIETSEITVETNTDIEINDSIILENGKLRLVFSNIGAVITSIQLKDYLLADKENYVELIPTEEKLFKMKFQGSTGDIKNYAHTVFEYSQQTDQISFFTTSDNQTIQKTFTISHDYGVTLDVKVNNAENLIGYHLSMDSGIADTEEFLKTKSTDYKIVSQINNEISKYKLSKLKEKQELNGKLDWTAIKSKYFIMAIVLDNLIDTKQLSVFKTNESPAMNIEVENNAALIDHKFTLHFGPLISDDLQVYGKGLENTVEMGPSFLQWLSKIFKYFLKFLNGYINSWGFSIIIFSILLKMLLYPLTHKSFESSTKMQKVQPLVKAVQVKYKGDPQTMNAEVKKLYKEHGVNPLGGCLPMLLQMPVIFALYPILRYSISLRQASFMWLPDLSEPDPIWALPILMAVFMFVQQKLMAPSKAATEGLDEKAKAAQQSQKMMMYMMPVMMFFIFKGLSSGLVLYWTVFSIIGSIQQYFIKKKFN